MNCSKCDRPIPDDSEFCPYCGEKANKICPACKRPILDDSAFCPYCGAELLSPVQAEPEQKDDPTIEPQNDKSKEENPANESVQSAGDTNTVTGKSNKFCRHCGGLIDRTTKKCTKCGKQKKITHGYSDPMFGAPM